MTISVVIPLYNKVHSVRRSIESALAQKRPPDEIIVVNDGSTDGSERLVEQLNHSLVRLIHQENAGVSAARNRGIELAKGEWVAFLDADDVWEPDYLQVIEHLRASYPSASVLATAYWFEDYKGIRYPIQLNAMPFATEEGLLPNYFQVASLSNPPIWSSAVVVKRQALIDVGQFPVGVTAGEDLLVWARLATRFEIAYSKRHLAIFVLDPAHSYDGKPTRIPAQNDFVGRGLRELYKNHPGMVGLASYVAHWHKMRASIYLRLGNRVRSLIELLTSLSLKLYQPKLYVYIILLLVPTAVANRVFKRFGAG